MTPASLCIAMMISNLCRALAAFGIVFLTALPLRAESALIFAAASLQPALDQIVKDWNHEMGSDLVVSYGSSAVLARQINQGAPAGLFISANVDWMDWLESRERLVDGSRRAFLGNELVLIGHAEKLQSDPTEQNIETLLSLVEGERISVGFVEAVPAGQYAKQALTHLGLYERLEGQLVETDNVRAALFLVLRQEVSFGIVYRSDTLGEDAISALYRFPEESHDPIRYPLALIREQDSEQLQDFYSHLLSDQAAVIFQEFGFDVVSDQNV